MHEHNSPHCLLLQVDRFKYHNEENKHEKPAHPNKENGKHKGKKKRNFTTFEDETRKNILFGTIV